MEKTLTDNQLAREVARLLEELVNLRYLLTHHPSYRETLKERESATLNRIVELVRDALVD
jgi:hypothetical protein